MTGCVSPRFSAPLAAKYGGSEKVRCRNATDLLYHHGEHDGALTSHAAESKSSMFFVCPHHAFKR